MEKSEADLTVVLRVNFGCCNGCCKKLKKLLLSLNGVNSVAVDPEEKLVFVTGKVDPRILVKAIAKMGKKAELIFLEKRNNDTKIDDTNSKIDKANKCQQKESAREFTKYKNCCCQDNNSYEAKKEDDGHNVKDYVLSQIEFNKKICRDPFYRTHRRKAVIRDHMPIGRPVMFWHPRPGYFNGANPHSMHWFRKQPNSHESYHLLMPRPAYVVHSGRLMPEFGNLNHYF